MLLAPLRPSPNLVTWSVCGLGLLAAGLLAAGQSIAGGFLAQATSVVDGVDGELARLQLRASRRGALLDGVLDRLADAAILAGLGAWRLRSPRPCRNRFYWVSGLGLLANFMTPGGDPLVTPLVVFVPLPAFYLGSTLLPKLSGP
jgi:phosphatidylserine synthase